MLSTLICPNTHTKTLLVCVLGQISVLNTLLFLQCRDEAMQYTVMGEDYSHISMAVLISSLPHVEYTARKTSKQAMFSQKCVICEQQQWNHNIIAHCRVLTSPCISHANSSAEQACRMAVVLLMASFWIQVSS